MAIFDEEKFAKDMDAVLNASESATFVELAALGGIDPKADLQHCDLAGVDFSNCDLRGWNFTGADLRRSHGENVIWDETTILTNADIEDSVFAKGAAENRGRSIG